MPRRFGCLETWCQRDVFARARLGVVDYTFTHIVANDANTIKEGKNDILLVHGLCEVRVAGFMGAALPVAIDTKAGEHQPAWGRWEGAIWETWVAVAKAKADAVFRLSETVKVQFLVALHGFVKSHVCCERALQCTATSANLRLAFAIESFLSRKSWPCRGRWQGCSDRDSICALRLFSRVGVLTIKRGKGEGMVRPGVGPWSGGRTY
ncbi:hypothetical protein BJV77DRAFT_1151448 [Russula vinacea]|nr:hypothetical protein BJV77DRAFT_1151448 [Russula vinacea]